MNKALENAARLLAEGKLDDVAGPLRSFNPTTPEETVEKMHLEGFLLERQENWEAAVKTYREVLEKDGDHSETLFRLAYLLDLHGEDEEAMQLYEHCIQDPPTHVHALMNLAVLYEDHGRFQEACEIMRSVVHQCPNNLRARLYLRDVESSVTMYYDEDRERTREKRNAILDTPISEFELSVRSRNCLKQMDIQTLGDLVRVPEDKLLAYKNFGETSLNEIKAVLSSRSLRLGQGAEEPPGAELQSAVPVPAGVAPQGDPALLNRSVAELELSVRSRKCLQRLGVSSIGDLVQRTEPELLSIKNFGQTSLSEIKRRLGDLGLSLRIPGK